MTREIIEVGGRIYHFSSEEMVPLAARSWAIVSARLTDEMTTEPPRSRITIETSHPGLTPRVASDGIVGLVGVIVSRTPQRDQCGAEQQAYQHLAQCCFVFLFFHFYSP